MVTLAMDALIYIANALFLLSYSVRDMLSLRVLAALASSCLVLYFATRPAPLLEAVFWNAFFALLNIVLASAVAVERARLRRRGRCRVRDRDRSLVAPGSGDNPVTDHLLSAAPVARLRAAACTEERQAA